MSCSTMSVSPEHRLSAKSVGGSSLPLERSPATTGVPGLEQEVVILSLLVETNKPDGAAATTQAKLDAGSGEGVGKKEGLVLRGKVQSVQCAVLSLAHRRELRTANCELSTKFFAL